jgi:hypothetical protein
MPSGITFLELPQILVWKLKSSRELISSIVVVDISLTISPGSLHGSTKVFGRLEVVVLTFLRAVETGCCSGFTFKDKYKLHWMLFNYRNSNLWLTAFFLLVNSLSFNFDCEETCC